MTLTVPGIGDVDAQVEWQRGGQFGARSYQPIALAACDWTMPERHNAWPACWSNAPPPDARAATMPKPPEEQTPVRLRNVSGGGAMIECERHVEPDPLVILDLGGAGVFEAEVRWSQRGQIDLKFAREFDLKRLAKARTGAGGLKMLTPAYLHPGFEAAQQSAAPSPLAKKSARRGR